MTKPHKNHKQHSDQVAQENHTSLAEELHQLNNQKVAGIMRPSTIVWIVVGIVAAIVLGAWVALPPLSVKEPVTVAPPTDVMTGLPVDASSTATTTPDNELAPGANLTLGQDSNPKVGRYLVAYDAMTLYAYSADRDGVSTCTGSCASTWMPYVVSPDANLVAESPINGKVATVTRPDGSLQVTYNGWPLYFYSKDESVGDINGQGIGKQWYVVAP